MTMTMLATPTKLRDPTKWAGCFELVLTCDRLHHPDDGGSVAKIIGHTLASCLGRAEKAGWRLHRESSTATCPYCSRKLEAMARREGMLRRLHTNRTTKPKGERP